MAALSRITPGISWVALSTTGRSLAVCAARDDSLTSLYGHALSEIARFIDVAAQLDGEVVE